MAAMPADVARTEAQHAETVASGSYRSLAEPTIAATPVVDEPQPLASGASDRRLPLIRIRGGLAAVVLEAIIAFILLGFILAQDSGSGAGGEHAATEEVVQRPTLMVLQPADAASER